MLKLEKSCVLQACLQDFWCYVRMTIAWFFFLNIDYEL